MKLKSNQGRTFGKKYFNNYNVKFNIFQIIFCFYYKRIQYIYNKIGFDHPNNKIDKIIEEMVPEDEKISYIYDFMASFLDDRISNDIIHIFAGKGSNGKSLLMKMIILTLSKIILT